MPKMLTSGTPAFDTMLITVGVGDSDRSKLPADTACAAAVPESSCFSSASMPYLVKNPASRVT
jgi:hypothetical protein